MANTLWQALSDTVERAVNLRVVTIYGDAVISGPIDNQVVQSPVDKSSSLVTNINIAAGDITTMVSPALHGPDFADIHALHDASVTQANAIIERNVNILVTLLKELADHKDTQFTPTPKPAPAPLPAPAPAPAPKVD